MCGYLLVLLESKEDVPCHSDIIPLAKYLTATEQTFFFFMACLTRPFWVKLTQLMVVLVR